MSTRTPYLQVADSGVHGLGVFVTHDLPTATLLGTYQGRRFSEAQLMRRHWDDGLTYLFSLSNGDTIDGSQGGNATRHINHSCEPNCEAAEEVDARGRLVLRIYALRPLLAGEELFLDYGLIVDESFTASDYQCFCRAPSCRGSMVAPPTYSSD
ncbi:SET domain-containing protein-lysine N-methyltransferase [Variovorax robiniae]|uniref:SET domain-containing protein-lysine N-methyltransferase n=1 Tax=Variovorax robiniae TaxID=1836199 RepID=A0ABU8XI92_9BURK